GPRLREAHREPQQADGHAGPRVLTGFRVDRSERPEAHPTLNRLADLDVGQVGGEDEDPAAALVRQVEYATLAVDRVEDRLLDLLAALRALEYELARGVVNADLDLHVHPFRRWTGAGPGGTGGRPRADAIQANAARWGHEAPHGAPTANGAAATPAAYRAGPSSRLGKPRIPRQPRVATSSAATSRGIEPPDSAQYRALNWALPTSPIASRVDSSTGRPVS